MTRNLKVLGLALVAVFAMSAMAASSASAQKLTSDGPVTLLGTQTGAAGSNKLSAFGGKTECASAKYTGHKVNVTPHEKIPSGASQATITPHYGVCNTNFIGINFSTTVDMNGCDYVFDLLTKTAVGTYPVRATVVCPAGQFIKVTLYSSGTHTSPFCTLTITHNPAGYLGLHATNGTGGHINIAGTIKGIEAHKQGSFPCPGTPETTTTAELALDVTVESTPAGTAISLSD
jgi:hypothetical protein